MLFHALIHLLRRQQHYELLCSEGGLPTSYQLFQNQQSKPFCSSGLYSQSYSIHAECMIWVHTMHLQFMVTIAESLNILAELKNIIYLYFSSPKITYLDILTKVPWGNAILSGNWWTWVNGTTQNLENPPSCLTPTHFRSLQ